jgi:predicted CoA-binding protein
METAVVNTTLEIQQILESAKTVAIVGLSDRPSRTSYTISKYLKTRGFKDIPVNPDHETVDGDECYPDLLSVPEDEQIDIVNIFRNPRYTADMVRIAIERSRLTGERFAIWTQLGVSSREAEQLAIEAGLPYVKNRCIMVEHSRMF